MPDFENISSQFINDLDKLQEDFIRRIEQGLKGNLSNIDLAELSADIDTLNLAGYDIKIGEYLKNYDDIIIAIHNEATARGLRGVVGAAAIDLEILANNEAIFLLDKGRLYTQEFKNALFRGIIGGESIGQILPSLRSIPLTDAQLTIGVSTGINRFQRTAFGKVYEEIPDQRFKLSENPLDIKTRASCKAVIQHQPKEGWTRKEINEGAATKIALQFMNETEHSPSERKFVMENGYTWVNAGFWNCRHDWLTAGEFKGKAING